MEDLLSQIEKGIEANLYYLSLFAALAVPDICGALGSEDGQASGKKYTEWFNKYVAHKYIMQQPNGQHFCFFNGEDCYCYRCSALHQGSSQPQNREESKYKSKYKSRYKRILFLEPPCSTGHSNIMFDAFHIDIKPFCQCIIAGARKWLNEVDKTEVFKMNYEKFMKRYPNGLKPYIVGVSVIS